MTWKISLMTTPTLQDDMEDITDDYSDAPVRTHLIEFKKIPALTTMKQRAQGTFHRTKMYNATSEDTNSLFTMLRHHGMKIEEAGKPCVSQASIIVSISSWA
ncbi:unnamed protein product [Strongylus vulgaris]|uniref:Uncharacterized protein n=1 Tax=Strongylus vulgaris TaxID=40348 RepID=A0A3P7LMP3_STRVU|nr:unnamed protein product [Strongylus vulgaris]